MTRSDPIITMGINSTGDRVALHVAASENPNLPSATFTIEPRIARVLGQQLVALADAADPSARVVERIRDQIEGVRWEDLSIPYAIRSAKLAGESEYGRTKFLQWMRKVGIRTPRELVESDDAKRVFVGGHAQLDVNRVARWLSRDEVPDLFWATRIAELTGGAVPVSSWEGQ